MRILIATDRRAADALKRELDARAPCYRRWELVSEPAIVIDDVARGLDAARPLSQGRWMLVCRDEDPAGI